VSGAVAGDDLERVACSTSSEIGHPVAISLPALGAPVVWPEGGVSMEQLQTILEQSEAAIAGQHPAGQGYAVPVRIGDQVAGIVAAVPAEGSEWRVECRAWLEAAAAAAAVTALMRENVAPRALLEALHAGPPADVQVFVAQARRLGIDLSAGAVALCGRAEAASSLPAALLAEVAGGRVLGLVPLADQISTEGMDIAVSAPRKDPALLHDALREAELLFEVAAGQEETYRLLIGVLLRDREELEQLRDGTISPLLDYDAEHKTDLLATLQAFLVHDGSTIDTAEAMGLHRHTVGYRLARVHTVSGLSPYESAGRERLSLGLKADQILAAAERLSNSG
jgi:PucR C-terminal helix-turn-helix domain